MINPRSAFSSLFECLWLLAFVFQVSSVRASNFTTTTTSHLPICSGCSFEFFEACRSECGGSNEIKDCFCKQIETENGMQIQGECFCLPVKGEDDTHLSQLIFFPIAGFVVLVSVIYLVNMLRKNWLLNKQNENMIHPAYQKIRPKSQEEEDIGQV
eukprot:TRINITY_DN1060_c0_g1_i10.p1 TRINITY_DN1060_c0_g1~~TRINITY_DN1060_c0_g1_i10.p1  ORF type:complete len:156 (-),score=22.38 TRINITY_DN1060_c0_g1_i10:89-556(-)